MTTTVDTVSELCRCAAVPGQRPHNQRPLLPASNTAPAGGWLPHSGHGQEEGSRRNAFSACRNTNGSKRQKGHECPSTRHRQALQTWDPKKRFVRHNIKKAKHQFVISMNEGIHFDPPPPCPNPAESGAVGLPQRLSVPTGLGFSGITIGGGGSALDLHWTYTGEAWSSGSGATQPTFDHHTLRGCVGTGPSLFLASSR